MQKLLLLSVVVVIGCSSSTSGPAITPDEVRIPPLAPASASASAPAPVASAGTTTDLPEQKPRHPAGEDLDDGPPPPPAIGSSCSNDRRSCGKSGKVAVEQGSPRMRPHKAPCAVTVTTQNSGMNVKRACVDGDKIYVSSACMACRIMSEPWMLGLITDMTPEQIADAQKLGGLPDKPPLTTIDAWKAAIAAAGSRATR